MSYEHPMQWGAYQDNYNNYLENGYSKEEAKRKATEDFTGKPTYDNFEDEYEYARQRGHTKKISRFKAIGAGRKTRREIHLPDVTDEDGNRTDFLDTVADTKTPTMEMKYFQEQTVEKGIRCLKGKELQRFLYGIREAEWDKYLRKNTLRYIDEQIGNNYPGKNREKLGMLLGCTSDSGKYSHTKLEALEASMKKSLKTGGVTPEQFR